MRWIIATKATSLVGSTQNQVPAAMRELRDISRDWMPGRPFALLVQDHHGEAGHGFGHRICAEDGVLGHGHTLFHVALAVCAVVDDLAVASKDSDGSGKLSLVDFVLDERMQVLKPVA